MFSELNSLGVHLGPEPGHLPLDPAEDLGLADVHLLHFPNHSLALLAHELVELNVIILVITDIWSEVLGAEDDNAALERLEVAVTPVVIS